MTTRVTEGDRRGTTKDDSFFLLGVPPSFLASRGFAAQCSRARALPLLNLKKKRDSSQSKATRKREEGAPDGRLGWSLSEVCPIPGSFFMPHWVKLCESAVRRDLSPLIWRVSVRFVINRQMAYSVTINRQKRLFFYRQPSLMRIKINGKKSFKVFQISLLVQLIFTGF